MINELGWSVILIFDYGLLQQIPESALLRASTSCMNPVLILFKEEDRRCYGKVQVPG